MTSRGISRYLPVSVGISLLALGHACPAQAGKDMQAEAERIVSQYKTVMQQPPGRVPSRDTVDGPLLGNGDLGAVIGGKPEAQRFWISKNNFWRLIDGHRTGGPRLFGGLEVNIPALAGATYLTEQDLYTAITTSKFTKGDIVVVMRSIISATADVLLVELSATGGPVEVDTRMWAAPGRGSKEDVGRDGLILWATKAFTEKVKIPTAAATALTVMGAKAVNPALEPVDAANPRKPMSQPGPKFTLEPGQKVTLALTMQSSYDSKTPLSAAVEMAKALNAEKVTKLLAEHTQWWRNFWAQSLVEIGDPVLEKNYYAANYVLGSALRDLDFPTGLFGLWVTHDDPRWAGDYHLNFDYQSQFYGLYSSNHIEQANTYHAPILAFMDKGKWYAKEILKIRGVYYCVGIGAMGIDTCQMGDRTNASYERGGCFMGQKCNAAYSVVPMSMHWYATYDKDYGKTVYPFVLEVANFWEDYLKYEPDGKANGLSGRYVIYNDSIQENSGADMNSIMSLGLVRNAFETVLDMSKELNVDAPRREKWQHILKHLSDLPTQEKDGKTVFRYTEKGTAWVNGNSCGIQHIYPAGAVGLDSDPKLLEIARNMITAMSRWSNDNGENSFYPAAVRVGCDSNLILEKLTMLWTTSRKRPNELPEDPEQCSTVPNTINEMLCMSHGQVLRVFPVWPRNKDARFWTLRAEGAFLVSSALKGGTVQYVKILSEKGRDCTVVNPWPGKEADVYCDGKKVETLKGDRFVMKTKAGQTVVLVPQGAVVPTAE